MYVRGWLGARVCVVPPLPQFKALKRGCCNSSGAPPLLRTRCWVHACVRQPCRSIPQRSGAVMVHRATCAWHGLSHRQAAMMDGSETPLTSTQTPRTSALQVNVHHTTLPLVVLRCVPSGLPHQRARALLAGLGLGCCSPALGAASSLLPERALSLLQPPKKLQAGPSACFGVR